MPYPRIVRTPFYSRMPCLPECQVCHTNNIFHVHLASRISPIGCVSRGMQHYQAIPHDDNLAAVRSVYFSSTMERRCRFGMNCQLKRIHAGMVLVSSSMESMLARWTDVAIIYSIVNYQIFIWYRYPLDSIEEIRSHLIIIVLQYSQDCALLPKRNSLHRSTSPELAPRVTLPLSGCQTRHAEHSP